jgi:hypothetical protein
MRRAAGMIAVLAMGAAYGCAAGEAEERGEAVHGEPLRAPHEVLVRTFDHQFSAPDTIEGGPVTIRLENEGPDFHHVWLVRLEDGVDVAELTARLSAHGHLPAGAVAVGGPNTPGAPGGTTTATLDLEPGDYLMVCVIPGMHDGELHVAKGMVRPLTAVAPSSAARLPDASVVMTLTDYSYELSAPIRAGAQTIRVVNAAAQAHEVVVVQLEPGRSAQDFLMFLQEPAGTPPGRMIGGTTWLDQGEWNLIELEFEPGDYALLCFVPDAGDGQLHLAHGMIQQFRVEP